MPKKNCRFAGMDQFQQRVRLHDLRFHAFHGYYPEEQVLGNDFIVAVEVVFDPQERDIEALESTVDYEVIYHAVKAEMEQPRKLLETVVAAILQRIRERYGYVAEISVAITKFSPPFGGDQANATVSLSWRR